MMHLIDKALKTYIEWIDKDVKHEDEILNHREKKLLKIYAPCSCYEAILKLSLPSCDGVPTVTI